LYTTLHWDYIEILQINKYNKSMILFHDTMYLIFWHTGSMHRINPKIHSKFKCWKNESFLKQKMIKYCTRIKAMILQKKIMTNIVWIVQGLVALGFCIFTQDPMIVIPSPKKIYKYNTRSSLVPKEFRFLNFFLNYCFLMYWVIGTHEHRCIFLDTMHYGDSIIH
jgi:hypothetical protein